VRNILLTLSYDGTDFAGWQAQAQGERTVQDTLSGAVFKVAGEPCTVLASGRTDSGVHALGAAASFQTGSSLEPEILVRALNANLPPDLRVLEARQMPEGFHPIRDAISKRYVYLIANQEVLAPIAGRYVCHESHALDTGAMARASEHLVGKHDFACFMASGSEVKGTVREVFSLEVKVSKGTQVLGFELPGRFIRIEVEGGGFLRHMVRNIAGTLMDVGKGRRAQEDMPGILASCERAEAGPTAPAKGLFLEHVIFK